MRSAGAVCGESLAQFAEHLVTDEAVGTAGAQCAVIYAEHGRLPATVERAFHAYLPLVRVWLHFEEIRGQSQLLEEVSYRLLGFSQVSFCQFHRRHLSSRARKGNARDLRVSTATDRPTVRSFPPRSPHRDPRSGFSPARRFGRAVPEERHPAVALHAGWPASGENRGGACGHKTSCREGREQNRRRPPWRELRTPPPTGRRRSGSPGSRVPDSGPARDPVPQLVAGRQEKPERLRP